MMIPVLGMLLGAQSVAPVLSVASLCANPGRALLFRRHIDWRVLRFLLPGSMLGAVIGSWSLTRIDPHIIQALLGLFLISYVLQHRLSLWRPAFSVRAGWFLPLGIAVSFLSGLVGATGPVLNPFLLNYGLEKERLVATKSLNSLLMQITKLTTYMVFGALTPQMGHYGLVLGLGSIVGVWLARRHLEAIEVARFRLYALSLMSICGVLMLCKGLAI